MSPVQNREKVAKKGTWHRSKTRDRYNKTCTHCDALVKSTLHPTLFTYASLECTSATYSPTAHLLLILALPLNVAVRPICATLSSVRKRSLLSLPLLLGDGQEELELRGQLLFRVEAVGEVNPADSAVGMNLDPQRLDIVRAIRSAGEVTEVELDLVPPLLLFLLPSFFKQCRLGGCGSIPCNSALIENTQFHSDNKVGNTTAAALGY